MDESREQFLSMSLRGRVERAFKILRSEARQKRFLVCIEGVRDETRIFCSLLSLALISENLSLDRYGIFYVCGIGRSGRKSASILLDRAAALGVLRRTKDCPVGPTDSLKLRRTEDCPPVLIRDYKRRELRKVKRKGLDLAVIFDGNKSYFPAAWHGMRVCGRTLLVFGRKRDSYQFCVEKTGCMVSIVKPLAETSLDRNSILAKYVYNQIRTMNHQLWTMIACYGLDAQYAKNFARFESLEELQAVVFLGFALLDPLKMTAVRLREATCQPA